MPSGAAPGLGARLRRRWRAYLRAIHRDMGYLLVGLTFVYALSGIAINHIEDWNPNFDAVSRTVETEAPLPAETAEATRVILNELDIEDTPDGVEDYGSELELFFGENRTIRADRATGRIFEDYQEPRFFLRVANWLHYNRGKKAWTYIADGYAAMLLLLAVSGAFMLKGRKGFLGRGIILISAGVAVPVLYVHFAGGP